jgi:segregation and condensation protein A
MTYDVHLENFEGPLDLLLYLIKKNDLEISEIPIAQITAEYLSCIDLMKELNLEIAGEFLVMASTLMQIKARMLLPRTENEQDEGPNPLEELKAKLYEYQKFKEVAGMLSTRETEFSQVYYRPTPVFDKEDYVLDVSLFDLLESFRSMIQELPKEVKEVVYKEIPIEQKIREILDLLEGKQYLTFREVFQWETTRRGFIVSFLSMLELIRLKQIIARQSDIFEEIRIYRIRESVIPEPEDHVQKELFNKSSEEEQREPAASEVILVPATEIPVTEAGDTVVTETVIEAINTDVTVETAAVNLNDAGFIIEELPSSTETHSAEIPAVVEQLPDTHSASSDALAALVSQPMVEETVEPDVAAPAVASTPDTEQIVTENQIENSPVVAENIAVAPVEETLPQTVTEPLLSSEQTINEPVTGDDIQSDPVADNSISVEQTPDQTVQQSVVAADAPVEPVKETPQISDSTAVSTPEDNREPGQ